MDTQNRFPPFEQVVARITAFTDFQEGLRRNARQWQERFEQIAAAAKPFVELPDKLRQQTQEWFWQHQESLAQTTRQFAARLADYERYINEEETEAVKLLAQGSWLGLERHLSPRLIHSALQICKTKGELAMNEAIGAYFNANDSALLVALSDDWANIPYIRDKQAVIRDAMSAHRAGQFTLSIPALLPLAEGLCAEILGINGTHVVSAVARDRSSGALDWGPVDRDVWVQLFRDVVEGVIYKPYRFGTDPAPFLNRHGILHGRVADYASELNSTRVFLLIDAVADLWHAKQGSLT
jgi:hypothetical protein